MTLPKGAGGVRCLDCRAEARADGHGTPIVLRHVKGCPQAPIRVVEDLTAEEMAAALYFLAGQNRDQFLLALKYVAKLRRHGRRLKGMRVRD